MQNLELAEKVLADVEGLPPTFRMGVWADPSYQPAGDDECFADFACGSAACLAGTTLIKAGGAITGVDEITMPDGQVIVAGGIGAVARRLLGLTADEYENPWHSGLWGLPEDVAVVRFRQIIEAEQARRTGRA